MKAITPSTIAAAFRHSSEDDHRPVLTGRVQRPARGRLDLGVTS